MPVERSKSAATDRNLNLKKITEIDAREAHKKSPASRTLHSRTIALVDLRLTRPPEALRPKEFSKTGFDDTSVSTYGSREDLLQQENKRISTPERRRRDKLEALGEIEAEIKSKNVGHGKELFADLTPAARRRLHAMLINFLDDGHGAFRNDISLHQFSVDCGWVVTNGTVQELCTVQPTLKRLDLADCENVSDVGLWAIARHCVEIEELILAGCLQITNIGLRSISLRCSEIRLLDLSNCPNLDDLGLSTIAGGCWKLETLLLRNCKNITDTGVGRIARACVQLQVLDLHGCSGVGDFGDHALKDIGAFCSVLRELDATGGRHVQDAGLRALAVGCKDLNALKLSGCDGVTGAGLKAIAKHCRSLKTLSLTGARQLTDDDVELLQSPALKQTLTALDLSGCARVTDVGVAAICEAVGQKLLALSVSDSCATDAGTKIIAKQCLKLRSLDLSRCRSITDDSVSVVAETVTGLTTLKLDGNGKVTTRAVTRYLGPRLEFAEFARDWLGYQPRAEAQALIEKKELDMRRTAAATFLQSVMRRKRAYKFYAELRRRWLINVVIPRAQARVRGVLQRTRYLAILLRKKKVKCVTLLQSLIRCRIAMKAFSVKIKHIRREQLRAQKALAIQCLARRNRAARVVQERRNQLANKRLAEAQFATRQQLCAIRIQTAVRALLARRLAKRLGDERDAALVLRLLRIRMSIEVERVWRGSRGRLKARNRRLEIALWHKRWRMARVIQRAYRGHRGRLRFKAIWEAFQLQIKVWACGTVQRCWRGYRGRCVAALTMAMFKLRQRRLAKAIDIQRVFRGVRGRRRVDAIKERRRQETLVLASTLLLQRVFRGHKGREASEIEKEVQAAQPLVGPLTQTLSDLEKEAQRLERLIVKLEQDEIAATEELEATERESLHTNHSNNKWTDSSRVNGVPQRFLTRFLRIRLVDFVKSAKDNLAKKSTELALARNSLRDTHRRIRAVQREMVPLTTGLVSGTRMKRGTRLRNRVRLERRSSTKIQALWRRAIVRKAYEDPYRDYWIQCVDEEQGTAEPYYYNTYSGVTSWTEPFAYRLFCRPDATVAALGPS